MQIYRLQIFEGAGDFMKKIVIVEDEKMIREELCALLENAGYQPVAVTDFTHTESEILNSGGDLVLLDINIPKMNGEQVLRELRQKSEIPVIMVTSRMEELDEVLSMSYGADDYITKPYSPTILLLRIQAILKRTENTGADLYHYRDIEIRQAKGVLNRGQDQMVLTKNEMLIFMVLLHHQGQIVSRDDLMTELWDNSEYISDNALTVNISRLRAKLEQMGYPDVIETRKKQGYVLV